MHRGSKLGQLIKQEISVVVCNPLHIIKATLYQKIKLDHKFDWQPQSSAKRDREVFINQKLRQINPTKFYILKIFNRVFEFDKSI